MAGGPVVLEWEWHPVVVGENNRTYLVVRPVRHWKLLERILRVGVSMLICLPPSKKSWLEGLLYLSGRGLSSSCYRIAPDISLILNSEGNRANFLYMRVV